MCGPLLSIRREAAHLARHLQNTNERPVTELGCWMGSHFGSSRAFFVSIVLSSLLTVCGEFHLASPKLLDQVREQQKHLSAVFWPWMCGAGVPPSRPFFFVAPEDRGGQLQHGPASIWQIAEVMAIVKRTREATWSSAFACGLRAADSPRLLAFISNLGHLSWTLVRGWQGWNSKEISCNIQALSVTAALVGKIIGHFDALLTEGSSQRKFFRSESGPQCTKLQVKPLGMAFQFRREVIKSVETKRKQSSSTLHHWATRLSLSPDSPHGLFQKVHGFVLPCSRK